MPLRPEDALLLDGIGACVSAAALGLALPAVQERIGLPAALLQGLAAVAVVLAVSSFAGWVLAGDRAARWLRATIVANVCYCVLTSVLVALHLREIRPLGAAYFGGEVVVIVVLVGVEVRALSRRQA